VSPAHLDQLSAADAAILALERGATHTQLGTLARFSGTAPDLDDLMAHVRRRLNLVPRFRQKLATPPLSLGRPRWVDGHRRDRCLGRDCGSLRFGHGLGRRLGGPQCRGLCHRARSLLYPDCLRG